MLRLQLTHFLSALALVILPSAIAHGQATAVIDSIATYVSDTDSNYSAGSDFLEGQWIKVHVIATGTVNSANPNEFELFTVNITVYDHNGTPRASGSGQAVQINRGANGEVSGFLAIRTDTVGPLGQWKFTAVVDSTAGSALTNQDAFFNWID